MGTQDPAVDQEVSRLLHDLPRERGQLLPALWRVVERYQALTPPLMEAVAQALRIPAAEVFGVASFYTLFDIRADKTPVYVCTDVLCALQGAQQLQEAGEAAAAGRSVVIKESACLGQCDHAPAVWIKGRVLRRVSAAEMARAVGEVPDA